MMSDSIIQPQGRFALTNGHIVLPDRVVEGRALVVEDGHLIAVGDLGDLGSDTTQLDVEGRIIAPGLIDIHIHGAVGHSFNEPDVNAWSAITGENVKRGVTSLLATLSTASLSNLLACLAFSRDWMTSNRDGTQVIGVHLEGPYFSYAQRGAQDPQYLRTPDDSSVDQLLAHADVLRIMSFAPELPGGLELTARLAKLGVVPAAGHSSAKDSDIQAAMRAGLRHTIHIWSGQSTTIREGPWRKPGLLEATLTFDDLTGEMITDNKHLPPTLMKLAYKCLGPDRLCAISDATNGAGLPEGTRFEMGDMTYEIVDGVAMLLDRTSFAGSSTLLNEMLNVLTRIVDVPLPEAFRMASLTPARIIGMDQRKGSITPGKDADIAVFNADFSAWRTMIAGQWVYAVSG